MCKCMRFKCSKENRQKKTHTQGRRRGLTRSSWPTNPLTFDLHLVLVSGPNHPDLIITPSPAQGLITSHPSGILHFTVTSRPQAPLHYRVVLLGRKSQGWCVFMCVLWWMDGFIGEECKVNEQQMWPPYTTARGPGCSKTNTRALTGTL